MAAGVKDLGCTGTARGCGASLPLRAGGCLARVSRATRSPHARACTASGSLSTTPTIHLSYFQEGVNTTKSVMAGWVLAIGLVMCDSALASTSSVKLTSTGFSASTQFSDSATVSQVASMNSSGFFVPFGVNPFGAPPASAFAIRYLGMAEATAYGGLLRGSIDAEQLADVLWRGGDVFSQFTGSFTLTGNKLTDPVSYVFKARLDGLLLGNAGVAGELKVTSVSDPTQSWVLSYASPSPSCTSSTGVDETLSLTITGHSGDTFMMTQTLTAYAMTSMSSRAWADFSNTRALTLVPQGGATLNGLDGFLSTAPVTPAVPEPMSAALLALGLVTLMWRVPIRH